MNPIAKAIRVGPSKALPSTILYDLGRVNVFCGKNNSGKSTLLEAIDSLNSVQFGLAMTGEVLAKATSTMGQAWANFNSADANSWSGMFSRVAATHKANLWFKDDAQEFLHVVREHITNGSGVGGDWNQNSVVQTYPTLFPDRPPSVSVPETRRLELEVPISENHRVEADGQGLLNYLFYAKNQLVREQPHRIYTQIAEAFTDISEGFSFDVVMPHDAQPGKGNTSRLFISSNRHDWMPARDCGFGLQELLMILYFATEPSTAIVCIEEPESHMHPEMQRKLAEFLRDHTAKQYFISTHSSVFLRPAIADRTFSVNMGDGEIRVADATSRAVLLSELGYDVLDNLVSDVLILTEGPTDKDVLEEFLRQRGLTDRYRIRFVFLGGDVMARVDLSPLVEHTSTIALIDRDPHSSSARTTFVEQCKRLGVPVTQLSRRAIENYFTVPALREVFGPQIPSNIALIDHDVPIKEQIGLEPKNKNWNVAHAMTLGDIRGTDLSAFLDDVERLCRESGPA